MKGIDTKKLMTAAIVGALYAALTMLSAPLSYGPWQLRIAEALCILPFYLPYTAWGLFLGCAAANVISSAGVPDIVFGSLATLLSCLAVAGIGRRGDSLIGRLTACLMPVIINGLIVGAVITYAAAGLDPVRNVGAFLVFAGQVALGELAAMLAIGLPLMGRVKRIAPDRAGK